MATTAAVRMYNVGFGDAFVVTVRRDGRTWRMLVDCGVHSQGQTRSIREVVRAIIADLKAEDPQEVARLDVVVATHHHADHISGFALEEWEEVEVGEVWVPFVEDPDDPDAKALRAVHTATALRLMELVERRTMNLDPGEWPLEVVTARAFAMNAFGNADSTDRLLGRNGKSFKNTPPVRYLPDVDPANNVVATPIDGVVAHVLGPPRDKDHLKLMHPPANAGWFRLDVDDPVEDALPALFNPVYVVRDENALPQELIEAKKRLNLGKVTNDVGLLAASSVLERAVNNTSVFFVLDVAGTKLLFPGDAQQGAWDHVLNDEKSRALVKDVKFYKIGHHGSHNATPKRYVEEILVDGAHAMLPWGLVKRWADTIPKTELLTALHAHNHKVTRADAPEEIDGVVKVHEDLWSEVTLHVP
jgi:beta-lactamase superfamily II metal-dependent hydrolase